MGVNLTPRQFEGLVSLYSDPNTGFRPISLCMHADYNPQLQEASRYYSSIWVKRPGPAWKINQYVKGAAALEAYLTNEKQNGFFPRLVGAVRNPNVPDGFCVVVEEGAPESRVEVGVAGVLLPALFEKARTKENEFVRWCAAYGSNNTQSGALVRHALLWERQPDVGKVFWNGFSAPDPADGASFGPDMNALFGALYKGFWRPDLACVVPGGVGAVNQQPHTFGPRYTSLWRDDAIDAWSFYWGIVETELATLVQGLVSWQLPIRLQVGGGPGPNQRMTVVFAASDQPLPRTMKTVYVTPSVDPSNPAVPVAPFASCDQFVKDLMVRENIRAAQLAITYDGRLVHAPAFTYAEAGYPETLPTNVMRIGSICKALTGIAVAHKWDQEPTKIDPFQHDVSDILGQRFTYWDQRLTNRKLIHFLSHCSRLIPQSAQTFLEPTRIAQYIYATQNVQKTQVTDRDWVDWFLNAPGNVVPNFAGIFTQVYPPDIASFNPPPSPPLPGSDYNAAGFALAGQCIAITAGFDTLAEAMLDEDGFFRALGITRARLVSTNPVLVLENTSPEKETLVHDVPGWAPDYEQMVWSNNQASAPHLGPHTYTWLPSVGASMGTWALAAVDLARIFSIWDLPDNPLVDQEWISPTLLYQYSMGWGMGLSNVGYGLPAPLFPIISGHNGQGLGCSAVVNRHKETGLGAPPGVVVALLLNAIPVNRYALSWIETGALAQLARDYGNTSGWPSWNLFHEVNLPTYGV
jgi:CubicO group peptidase (beta-lactamase class C family)